jgi:hypothetical protein
MKYAAHTKNRKEGGKTELNHPNQTPTGMPDKGRDSSDREPKPATAEFKRVRIHTNKPGQATDCGAKGEAPASAEGRHVPRGNVKDTRPPAIHDARPEKPRDLPMPNDATIVSSTRGLMQ